MDTTRLITVVALALGLLVPATAASASCILDERPLAAKVDEAKIVFVGRVTGLRDNDRIAQFAVEEVWKGRVPPEVVVHGGPGDPQMATSNDRTWVADQRYLVFPYREGGRLMDNFCTPTAEWRPAMARARPEGAVRADDTASPSEPAPEGTERATTLPVVTSTPWLAIAIGAAVVGLGAAALVFARRRRRDVTPGAGSSDTST
ncbi:MAG: hypothetical protein LC789_09425 [Actinobacteria bacterium]|nr:hypothetical protein [Actinomycetota bacterium]